MGVLGLQAGFMIASVVLDICYAIIIAKADWQKVADDAVERIKREAAELIDQVTVNDSIEMVTKS